jgi:hypothetical protein
VQDAPNASSRLFSQDSTWLSCKAAINRLSIPWRLGLFALALAVPLNLIVLGAIWALINQANSVQRTSLLYAARLIAAGDANGQQLVNTLAQPNHPLPATTTQTLRPDGTLRRASASNASRLSSRNTGERANNSASAMYLPNSASTHVAIQLRWGNGRYCHLRCHAGFHLAGLDHQYRSANL